VYLKAIRFDTLKIIFESTQFGEKNFLFRKLLKFGEICHCNTDISAILKVFWLIFILEMWSYPKELKDCQRQLYFQEFVGKPAVQLALSMDKI